MSVVAATAGPKPCALYGQKLFVAAGCHPQGKAEARIIDAQTVKHARAGSPAGQKKNERAASQEAPMTGRRISDAGVRRAFRPTKLVA